MIELVRGDGVAMGVDGDLLVVFYEKTPTMDGTIAIGRGFEVDTHSVALLIVIGHGALAPDGKVRGATQKIIQRQQDRTAAMAYAVGGGGFGGAAARAAISGMLLFARPPYPTKVFSEVGMALNWLKAQSVAGRKLEIHVSSAEVERFCAV